MTGTSIVLVEVKAAYTDLRPIWDNLRRKIDKVRPDLPAEVIGPTVNDEFGDVFGIVAALTGEGFSFAELKKVADEVREELLLLPDVAKVSIHGAQEERIFVEFSSTQLSQLGLSTYQLLDILKRRNIIIPGGYLQTGDERIALEPSGNFESLDEIKRTVVSIPGRKEVLYLGDIVTIRRGYIDPPAERARFKGKPALAVAISMREGGNMVELGRQVKPVIARLQGAYPWGINFDIVAFQPDVVTQKTDEFTASLLQAVGVVIAVMLLTLGLRTGLVVASLIPAAIIMAILVMSVLGIGLDQMSLASLIIALGLLVDNAIVMSESILVQMERGKSAVQAALGSAGELRVPLLVASLTTAAAFLPIFLAESEVGEYTAPLFKVVTITLLCSWVLALTLTPLLCVAFLKLKDKNRNKPREDGALYRLYRAVLCGMLRRRALSLCVITLVFFGVMALGRFVPALFFPNQVTKQFVGDVKLAAGTPIEKTERMVKKVDRFIAKELAAGPGREEGIADWTVYVGNGGPKFRLAYNAVSADPGYAMFIINATSADVVPGLQRRLNEWCRENLPDAEANFKDFSYGPPVDNPVEVKVYGRRMDQVFARADEIKRKLRQISGTRNIDDNWGRPVKKLLVKVNQARARRSGVTNQDIALSLQTIFSGFGNTAYREGDKVIPISLRSVAADRTDVGKIETLSVYSQSTGKAVPLKQVADIELRWNPGRILRENRLKAMTVSSQLQPGVLAAQVTAELAPWLEEESKSWALGMKYKIGGSDEASQEGNQSIMEKLPIAGFLILMLLVAQFNNVRKPLIILTTIPLALIGVILGLLILRSYMGFMTLLGIVSLAGIVINNGIVLLDRIRIEMEEHGRSPQDAIVSAAVLRIRPILLTTATTIGGLLPLYLGGGPMWEPMAVAIMFGLLFSTMLTLGFVPVCYAALYRVRFR
jgi:multidrug efflux pump subunit AcrB